MKKKRVFLGGTCNGSNWRNKLIPSLTIDFFDPVVDNWKEENRLREIEERERCDYCLYVITPRMVGSYAIAEAIDDSNKRPEKTIFCLLDNDDTGKEQIQNLVMYSSFTSTVYKSLTFVGEMVKRNGGKFFTSLEQVIEYLNGGE